MGVMWGLHGPACHDGLSLEYGKRWTTRPTRPQLIRSYCKAVDGHVATREDFDTEEAYKDVLKKYGPWFMRTPVGRAPSFTAKALPNCQKDPDFKKHRKFWSYYDRDGSSMKIPDNVWHDQNPTNMCADMRRTTAVMHKDGYVDVPPFLRRPVICVSG
ncbi:hypothetical protein Y032_0279g1184 [Ancylostoma ceylanicum]|uniref:Uncharacterized protein n=1 Tax=Ancylostoma ceylanicum TaxID=53326 RepID=A0A016S7S4_9BILA|nr:hypothetical protein Y032_0279g1184 [Ancylostoma ceylanicum]